MATEEAEIGCKATSVYVQVLYRVDVLTHHQLVVSVNFFFFLAINLGGGGGSRQIWKRHAAFFCIASLCAALLCSAILRQCTAYCSTPHRPVLDCDV